MTLYYTIPVTLMTVFFSFWDIGGNFSMFPLTDVVSASYICFSNCQFFLQSLLQVSVRGFKTYFVNYKNMDITYSQKYSTKYGSDTIYN